MATTTDYFTAVTGIYVIPYHKMIANLFIRLIIGALKRREGAVGEDDAPAIGDIGRIALDDSNFVRRIGLFDEQPRVESRRACTKDYNFHNGFLPRPFSTSASLFSWARSGT